MIGLWRASVRPWPRSATLRLLKRRQWLRIKCHLFGGILVHTDGYLVQLPTHIRVIQAASKFCYYHCGHYLPQPGRSRRAAGNGSSTPVIQIAHERRQSHGAPLSSRIHRPWIDYLIHNGACQRRREDASPYGWPASEGRSCAVAPVAALRQASEESNQPRTPHRPAL
jgi:hypothetical protein